MQKGEPMDDLISRAAVVDAIEGVDWYHINKNGEMVHGANDAEHQAWYKADDIYAAIERVPSAVPVAKDTNVPVKDCISRQAAIEVIEAGRLTKLIEAEVAINGLRALPSAQPEPLTDKEQRIFLAAMSREEKVCKEVDAEMTREPYEDSLVRVCHEITRKVKGALWT